MRTNRGSERPTSTGVFIIASALIMAGLACDGSTRGAGTDAVAEADGGGSADEHDGPASSTDAVDRQDAVAEADASGTPDAIVAAEAGAMDAVDDATNTVDAIGDATADATVDATDAGAFPACDPSDGASVPSYPGIGLATIPPFVGVLVIGTVTMVAATRLEVTAGTETTAFAWDGPTLAGVFAVGDDVQVVGNPSGVYGRGGWSIVRSARATAAVLDMDQWTVLGTAPGSTANPNPPADFPTLVYALDFCCRNPGFMTSTVCSFASLEVSYAGTSVPIPPQSSATLGPWSITSFYSLYTASSEYVWQVRATLLGPATARQF